MYRLLILTFLCCGLFACTKEKEKNTFCINGTVEWMGSPAADGLGWVLKKDTDSTQLFQVYIPSNLSEGFQKHGLAIQACLYQTDEKAGCFCANQPYKYFITSIQKR